MTIDYTLDPVWGRADDRIAQTADELDLRYSLFTGDIHVQVGSYAIHAAWGWIPVIDFLVSLGYALDEAFTQQYAEVDFTENEAVLKLERSGDALKMSASFTPGFGLASYEEFRAALMRCADKLDRELVSRHTELAKNPAYRKLIGPLILR